MGKWCSLCGSATTSAIQDVTACFGAAQTRLEGLKLAPRAPAWLKLR